MKESVSGMKTTDALRLELRVRIERGEAGSICDRLAAETGLSKSKIKKAMQQGAVQLKRAGHRRQRIRRATATLRPGDLLEAHMSTNHAVAKQTAK